MSLRRFAPVLLLLAASSAPAAPASPPDARRLGSAIDAFTRPLLDRGELSGQLLVSRGDRVLVERSFGWTNRELGVRMTPKARLNIASVTKPMTVDLVIHAIEAHKMAVGDSIARWLPDFPRGKEITISHLLRHRSGIVHEILPDSESTRPRTAAEMVAFAARRPLDFDPGTKSNYSSGGFTVLARILELTGGQSYDSLIVRELLRPLGMTHSGDANGSVILPGRAACYVPGATGLEVAAYQDFSGIVGAGSVWSTAHDLHRFVRAVVTGARGEGMRQSFLRDGKLDFNGRTSGFNSFATFDSASGLELVWIGNVASGAPDLIKAAIPRLAAGERLPPPAFPTLAATPPPAADLARLEGVFQLENGTKLRLHVADGVLWANEWILQPTAAGDFFSPRDYGRIQGVPGADGSIARLNWIQDGKTYPAPRVIGDKP
ncbi:MAG: serine hydrolase domain-containing protein [Candidatus Eisenbacteria bacterium]